MPPDGWRGWAVQRRTAHSQQARRCKICRYLNVLPKFLILGEEILCRPTVGADGLYNDVLPIRNKREGAKSTA